MLYARYFAAEKARHAEEGIVESGTHEQLLAKQGVYYRLWNQLPGEDTL